MSSPSLVCELYGHSTRDSGSDWTQIAADQHCPFLERKCIKIRKSDPDQTIGTCSVRTTSANVMICPFRMIERRQIFEDCKHLALQHEAGNEWHVVSEISIPGGSVDYCLASVRRGRVQDFVGIEVQTMDTTGSVWPARQKFLRAQGVQVEPGKNQTFGMNWKMTAKTTLVQLHHKVETFEHLSKKLVLACQDVLAAYMAREFTFAHWSNPARLGDSMHVHSYTLEATTNVYELELAQRISTDMAGIASSLKMQSDAKVELTEIVNAIEAKLSASTLLALAPPPAPSKVIVEGTED